MVLYLKYLEDGVDEAEIDERENIKIPEKTAEEEQDDASDPLSPQLLGSSNQEACQSDQLVQEFLNYQVRIFYKI